MEERLFIHVNWGPWLTRAKFHEDDWGITVNVDGKNVRKIEKSDFIRISRGEHKVQLFFYIEWGDSQSYVDAWGTDILVEDSDVHLTVNIYFLKEGSVEFLEGNVECNPEKGRQGWCYVATAVYGSYDCPPVWTLRRFRDEILGATWYGRAFIYTYYAISPTLVKWFGDKAWFKKMWRKPLDALVKRLEAKGIPNTSYKDKEWRKKQK